MGLGGNGLSQLENADELRRELQSPCWDAWDRDGDGDRAAPWAASLGYLQPTAIPERSWSTPEQSGTWGRGSRSTPTLGAGTRFRLLHCLGSCVRTLSSGGAVLTTLHFGKTQQAPELGEVFCISQQCQKHMSGAGLQQQQASKARLCSHEYIHYQPARAW